MQKHYICLGGCKGVSEHPGLCQSPDCMNHKHDLVECKCVDGNHNDFKKIENSVEDNIN
ncbi:MAG: hypothetical protein M3Q34_03710 [bacterium]|nr:hypothetical protein [bacterium]